MPIVNVRDLGGRFTRDRLDCRRFTYRCAEYRDMRMFYRFCQSGGFTAFYASLRFSTLDAGLSDVNVVWNLFSAISRLYAPHRATREFT